MNLAWSIRTRLLLLIAVMGIGSIGVAAYSLKTGVDESALAARSDGLRLARGMALSVEQMARNLREMLERLARRPELRIPSLSGCDPILEQLGLIVPQLANLVISNGAGDIVCLVVRGPGKAPASVAQREVFKQVAAAGKFTVGEPFVGPVTGRWVAVLAEPRRDDSGRFIGALHMPVDLEKLSDDLAKLALPTGWTVTVVSAAGTVLARSADSNQWVGHSIRQDEIWTHLAAASSGDFEATGLDGTRRYYGYTTLPTTGWRVYAGIPVAEAHAADYAGLRRVGTIMFAITLGAMALALYLSRGIERPVRVLADIVKATGSAGKYERAPLAGPREITDVAAEFNRMLDRREQTEAALRESEALFHSVADVVPVGIFRSEPDRGCVYVNPRWCEIVGISATEALGRHWPRTMHPEDREPITREWKTVVQQDRPSQIECRFLRPDGEVIWVLGRAAPERDAQGKTVAYVGAITDITERKRQDDALRDYAERLQALAKQMIEVQENERRALARELHDEIGQVLTAVKINLQAARQAGGARDIEPRLADSIGVVETAIRQVRDRSLDLRPTLLDDLGLLPALDWYLEKQSQRSGIPITFDFGLLPRRLAPEIETVCYRLVQEAVTNVLRHAGAKNIKVVLRARPGTLSLRVEDDGKGFDPDSARARRSAGEASGLLGMEERVRLVNGKIELDSLQGRGTRLRVHLPVDWEAA